METWDAIRSRRNVRTYTDEPIGEEDLDRILEAGWRTPSSRNSQPWDFVVVTDKRDLERLSKVWQGARHVAQSAATIAVVAPIGEDEQARSSIHYDLGQATITMMITAADLGVGSAHSAVTDQALAQEILLFPDGYLCAWLIALGHPADRPLAVIRNPSRRPFDEVAHRGRW